MKNLIFFVTACMTLSIVACQNSQDTKQDTLFNIASSELYSKYTENFNQRAYLVATKTFDGEAIDRILSKYPNKLNSCDFDRTLFEDIRGGLIWYDNDCEGLKILMELDERFGFRKLSVEEKTKIKEIHQTIMNLDEEKELEKRIFDNLQKNGSK